MLTTAIRWDSIPEVIWIVVFCALALGGAVVLAVYAVSLAHKAEDVRHEIGVVVDRANQISALVGRLELPPAKRD